MFPPPITGSVVPVSPPDADVGSVLSYRSDSDTLVGDGSPRTSVPKARLLPVVRLVCVC